MWCDPEWAERVKTSLQGDLCQQGRIMETNRISRVFTFDITWWTSFLPFLIRHISQRSRAALFMQKFIKRIPTQSCVYRLSNGVAPIICKRAISTSSTSGGTDDPNKYCRELARKHDYEGYLTCFGYPAHLRDGYFALKAFNVRNLPNICKRLYSVFWLLLFYRQSWQWFQSRPLNQWLRKWDYNSGGMPSSLHMKYAYYFYQRLFTKHSFNRANLHSIQ